MIPASIHTLIIYNIYLHILDKLDTLDILDIFDIFDIFDIQNLEGIAGYIRYTRYNTYIWYIWYIWYRKSQSDIFDIHDIPDILDIFDIFDIEKNVTNIKFALKVCNSTGFALRVLDFFEIHEYEHDYNHLFVLSYTLYNLFLPRNKHRIKYFCKLCIRNIKYTKST